MTDQLREAARALLAVVDEREPGMRGYYIASERFAALRAALDAPQAGPAVEACPSCGLADPLLHPCDASGHASLCNDAFHRTASIRRCAEPGCEVVGLTKRVEWRCVPHMDPPAPQAEPVMWAIRDRHGAYSNETRAEEQIRAVCDYLNRDPSEAHYIARGPYEVVPLIPLVRGKE